MTAPLIRGLSKNSNFQFECFTPSGTRAKRLADEIGGEFVLTLEEVIKEKELIFLGFKPQNLDQVANQVRGKLSSDVMIFSILAGKTMKELEERLAAKRIVRLMPNTPVEMGAGVLPFCQQNVSTEQYQQLLSAFESLGEVIATDEKSLGLMTPHSGSGPAFLFELARIWQQKMIADGFNDKIAKDVVLKVFQGASLLMNQRADVSFEELRNQVTSKGGVTFAALEKLRENDWDRLFNEAIDSAHQRGREL